MGAIEPVIRALALPLLVGSPERKPAAQNPTQDGAADTKKSRV